MKNFSSIYIYCIMLLFILLITFLAPWITPYDPEELNMEQVFLPMSFKHILGTDDLGRDIFSRILYGGRISIGLSFIVTLMASIIGLIIGMAAGFYGKEVDLLLTSVSVIFQGIPGIIILIAMIGILGIGIKSILIAIPLISWVGFSRIVRGEVMKIKRESYIEAAKSMGLSNLRIMFRHILPNIMESIIILFTNRIGSVLLSISSLSYLGFGLQPPTADWGLMINEGRIYYESCPIMILGPGFCIIIIVFSVHSIGNWLRDRFDSRNEESIDL